MFQPEIAIDQIGQFGPNVHYSQHNDHPKVDPGMFGVFYQRNLSARWDTSAKEYIDQTKEGDSN